MKKKLVVVADDFGFSEAYNYGVIKAYKEGIVTVLSLMSNMKAAAHAVELWKKEVPEACLVQHTNFVQGYPVSKPEDIPSLVDENGMFYRSNRWKGEKESDKKCVGDIVVDAVDCYKETVAQLNRHKELTGRYPIHFEGHSVMTAPVKEAFMQAGEEFGIHSMATPERETDRMYVAHELALDNEEYMPIIMRGATPDDFYEDRLGLLKSPFEINIMHFHPGYLDAYLLNNTSLTIPRCIDLETLCNPQVREWIIRNNVELTDFTAVYKRRKMEQVHNRKLPQ